jgi:hypothetical protein
VPDLRTGDNPVSMLAKREGPHLRFPRMAMRFGLFPPRGHDASQLARPAKKKREDSNDV